MLFADILRSRLRTPRDFVGHLGGDDFFACLDAPDPSESFEWLSGASDRFAREVVSFYSAEDRDRGWILGKDSARKERRMGLLTVSLAAVHLPAEGGLDAEGLSDLFAVLKREAKATPDHRALRIVDALPPSTMAPFDFPRSEDSRGRPDPVGEDGPRT